MGIHTCVWLPNDTRRGDWIPGAAVIGELPGVGAGNQTPVFFKST